MTLGPLNAEAATKSALQISRKWHNRTSLPAKSLSTLIAPNSRPQNRNHEIATGSTPYPAKHESQSCKLYGLWEGGGSHHPQRGGSPHESTLFSHLCQMPAAHLHNLCACYKFFIAHSFLWQFIPSSERDFVFVNKVL